VATLGTLDVPTHPLSQRPVPRGGMWGRACPASAASAGSCISNMLSTSSSWKSSKCP
jgi:hypothetical protein